MAQQTDIIIVGGGLTGSLAALALADAGFSIVLVDADHPAAKTDSGFDGRTTALAYASVRLVQKLGLWDALEPQAEPIRDILVTDGLATNRFRKGEVSLGFLHFDSREISKGGDETPLGWIVENRLMRQVFYDAISSHANIRLVAPALSRRMITNEASASIQLSTDETLSAKLVIAADGRGSPLREQASIKTVRWTYPQTGIVCTVAHEKDHQGIAQEFFLPGGPFAILPMTEQRSSLVWTEKAARARAFLALDDDEFLAEIKTRFGPYLGDLSLASPRWSHPLSLHLASEFYSDRLAIIGDAAHGIHPIAGQGFNLGIKDIAALHHVLAEAQQTGLDISHGTLLARYNSWRRFDSVSLAFGTDALNRLMSVDNRLLRQVRSAGMGLVNRVDPLRKMFMHQAGADLGSLPQLLQP